MKARVGLVWVVLALLYVFHVQLKTTKIIANQTWSATDETGQFWSEFAVHYRFAKFFATHPVADWAQLGRDRDIQHPDTINDWAEFTLAMEIPAGVSYRLFQPGIPLHVWVVWFDCLAGSLAIFGVFLLARGLWRDNFAGLMAAFFYVALYPSYGRAVKHLFLKEDFALPLILFAAWATVAMWQSRRRWPEFVAALLWLAALASWHLTQFVFAAGVVAATVVYLGVGETPRRPWFVTTLAAGSLAVPVLWAKQFWISPPMCALYALTLAVWINGGRKRASLVFAGWLMVLLAGSFWLRQSYGEYAHVYQLFVAKLRFLGVKPEEPGRLTWEARCLWEGAFETAGAGEFWRYLGWTLPLAFVAVWRTEKRRDWNVERRVAAVFALLLVGLAWMVIRYFTFLAPVAAVLAAGVVAGAAWWKLVAGAAACWQLAGLDYAPLDRAPVKPALYRPVVGWLMENTPTNAVVLASISESPVFGRPMILHSKFENRAIRERYRQFLAALYGSEDDLYRFATRYGADYFVFDAGCRLVGENSWRYKADKLEPLPATAPARLLWERPGAATRFEQQFATERFIVYRVKR
jgi:hypothetical protein